MSSYLSFAKDKRVKLFVVVIVFAVSIYYVIHNFDWKQIWLSIKQANLIYFFSSSIITLFLYFLLRATRWYALLRSENLGVPFTRIYLYSSISIGLSTITPFQSGEIAKVELLRKYGIHRSLGYTTFFLEKLLDLSLVVALGIVGTLLTLNLEIPRIYYYVLVVAVLAVAAFIIIIFLFPFAVLASTKALLIHRFRQKKTVILTLLTTAGSWLMVIIGWKMILSSVLIEITFLQASTLVALTTLLAIISLIPGGIGAAEIGSAAILSAIGIEPSLAQTGAIIIRTYALVMLILSLIHWLVLKLLSKPIREVAEK